MNEIVSNLLLAGDNFMPEIHLTQPEFTYNTYGSFIKNKETKQKFEKTGYWRCIYQIKLDNACFQHGIAYGNFEDLTRRTGYGKILHNKAFNIAKKWWTS